MNNSFDEDVDIVNDPAYNEHEYNEHEYNEHEYNESHSLYDSGIEHDVVLFLSDLCTSFVRTIPQIDNDIHRSIHLEEMKKQIVDMFYQTEFRYTIDSLNTPPTGVRAQAIHLCVRLLNGVEPCGEQTMDGSMCCFDHTMAITYTDQLVLSIIQVGFDLGEVLDILENDIDPTLQDFMRTIPRTIPRNIPTVIIHLHYSDVEMLLQDDESDEEEQHEIPKYKDIIASVIVSVNIDCPVCLEEDVKKPIILGCSHNVCYDCLEKLNKLTCPCCRTVIDITKLCRVAV